jgi:hypothetical protein
MSVLFVQEENEKSKQELVEETVPPTAEEEYVPTCFTSTPTPTSTPVPSLPKMGMLVYMLPVQEADEKNVKEVCQQKTVPPSVEEELVPTSTQSPTSTPFGQEDGEENEVFEETVPPAAQEVPVPTSTLVSAVSKNLETNVQIAPSIPKKKSVGTLSAHPTAVDDKRKEKDKQQGRSSESIVRRVARSFSFSAGSSKENGEVDGNNGRSTSLSRLVMSEDKDGNLKAFRNMRKLASRTCKGATGKSSSSEAVAAESEEVSRGPQKVRLS